jgi:hypothetical protein
MGLRFLRPPFDVGRPSFHPPSYISGPRNPLLPSGLTSRSWLCMTKQWFLLNGMNRDAKVMQACADVIRGFTGPAPANWPNERLNSALDDCIGILGALDLAARVQLGETLAVDPYFYRLSLRVARTAGLTPSRLHESVSTAVSDLRERKLSDPTVELLKVIVRTSQKQATGRWVELRSSPSTASR